MGSLNARDDLFDEIFPVLFFHKEKLDRIET